MPPVSKAAEHEEERLLSKGPKTKGQRGSAQPTAMKPGKGRKLTKQATARAANVSFRLPNKPVAREKGMGTQHRDWIKMEKDGKMTSVQLKQHQLMHQLGIQPRDLRLLDLLVATSYPSAILSRDSAIVVNLERYKCIITTDAVLLPAALYSEEPDAFLQELQNRIRSTAGSCRPAAVPGTSPNPPQTSWLRPPLRAVCSGSMPGGGASLMMGLLPCLHDPIASPQTGQTESARTGLPILSVTSGISIFS